MFATIARRPAWIRLIPPLVIFCTAIPARAQQMADPDFDTRVAKPAFVSSKPRLMFDEAHNNFHTSTGRYKPFADLIGNDGYQVTPNKARFTKKSLEGFAVLVIANASGGGERGASAFTDEECDAVRDWVQAGGSLLLIADHAPFGKAAESLAKRFAVEMSTTYTLDEKNYEKSMGATCLVFSSDNKLLGDHSIIRGRGPSEAIRKVTTFTGQSLKGPKGSVAFLALADTAEDLDRANNDKRVSAAGRAQGLALQAGKGRVVVMGEAAVLSAQVVKLQEKPAFRMGMNFPGSDNRQLALNIMHWLSRVLD